MKNATEPTTDPGGPHDRGGLRIEDISHRYGTLTVLDRVSFSIEAGEFLTLLGASGSGKTTLLRIIGGLITPASGRVCVGGRDITRLAPEKRDIGFVFQNYALFPHMTVDENVAFALTVRHKSREEVSRQVREALDMVGLERFGSRYPGQLSGGQQQRVALARALVFNPAMLLLDEPLGALDRGLRQQLAVELRDLQRRSGITMIYVTHDQEEAFTMSTQVAVMEQGRIRQMAPQSELYRSPVDLSVARFVGDINEESGRIVETADGTLRVETPAGTLLASRSGAFSTDDRVIAAIRPEHLDLKAGESAAGPNRLSAVVRAVIFGGSWHRIDVELPSGSIWRAEGRGEPPRIEEGSKVTVSFDADRLMLFKNKEGFPCRRNS